MAQMHILFPHLITLTLQQARVQLLLNFWSRQPAFLNISLMYRLAKAKREAPDYILVIKAINDKLGNSKPVKRTFKSLLNLSSLLFIFKGEAGWFNNKYNAVRIMQIEVSTDDFSLLQMLLKKQITSSQQYVFYLFLHAFILPTVLVRNSASSSSSLILRIAVNTIPKQISTIVHPPFQANILSNQWHIVRIFQIL